jgi:hypothetical protein
MINKKIVWRSASRLGDGDFSIIELIDEISKESESMGSFENKLKYFDPEDIINCVVIHTDVTKAELKSKKRNENIKNARHIAIYLVYKYTEKSTNETGLLFNRNHSTVIHACKRIKYAKDGYDPELLKSFKTIEKTVLSQRIEYVKKNDRCNVEGCNGKQIGNGYCYKHQFKKLRV